MTNTNPWSLPYLPVFSDFLNIWISFALFVYFFRDSLRKVISQPAEEEIQEQEPEDPDFDGNFEDALGGKLYYIPWTYCSYYLQNCTY